MGIIRFFTALALLALWIPATSQCLLERAAVLQAPDTCCPNSPDESPPKSSTACCALALGHYKPGGESVRPVVTDVFLVNDAVSGVLPVPDAHADPLFCYPIKLNAHWQFRERTALPVRAPCLAS